MLFYSSPLMTTKRNLFTTLNVNKPFILHAFWYMYVVNEQENKQLIVNAIQTTFRFQWNL